MARLWIVVVDREKATAVPRKGAVQGVARMAAKKPREKSFA